MPAILKMMPKPANSLPPHVLNRYPGWPVHN